MHDSLMYELTVFAGAGAAGLFTAFLYDLFRLKRRLVKTGSLLIQMEDILFWISATIILFLASYILSSGETRFYFFSGIILGAVLYLKLLSKLVLHLLVSLIQMLMWPIREVYKLLKPVILAVWIKIKKLLGKTRNKVALNAYYARVDMRRFRNALTKK